MKNTENVYHNLLIKQIEEEHNNLLTRQTEAIKDLFDEFEMMFAIVKADLSKRCSLQTMRYMLVMDVFLNELKDTVFNYNEDEEEMDIW